MSSAVAHALPPSVLALFAPRPPIVYKPPIEKRKMPNYTTIAQFVQHFEDPKDTPPAVAVETIEERRTRMRTLKTTQATEKLEAEIAKFDPAADPNIGESDPYKTLFVARIGYETTEESLRNAFEMFGPIKSIKLVQNSIKAKPRGYGFIEFEHERDMKTAYKQGDGKKVDGRRVLVDVERGRTVRNWRPRRLGGGLGSTRLGGKSTAIKNSGRDLSGFGPGNVGASQVGSSPRPSGIPTSGGSGGAKPSFTWSTKTTDEVGSYSSGGGHGGGAGGHRSYGGDRGGGGNPERGDRERDRERDRDRGGDRGRGDRYDDRGYDDRRRDDRDYRDRRRD